MGRLLVLLRCGFFSIWILTNGDLVKRKDVRTMFCLLILGHQNVFTKSHSTITKER